MRDFLISGFGRIAHNRTDGRRNNTKILSEQEEQGLLGKRVFYPRRWEGSEKDVGEGGRDAAGCKRRAGSGWMGLEEGFFFCEAIRMYVSVCEMGVDKGKEGVVTV